MQDSVLPGLPFCRLFAVFFQLLLTLFFDLLFSSTFKNCVFVFQFFSFSIFSLILLFLEVSIAGCGDEAISLSHSGR